VRELLESTPDTSASDFTRENWIQALATEVLELIRIQEEALGTRFVIKYGEDLYDFIHRYRRIAAKGPWPRYPIGDNLTRAYDLICNLTYIFPDRELDIGDWNPEDPYAFDRARERQQYLCSKLLALTLSEAEFHLTTLPVPSTYDIFHFISD